MVLLLILAIQHLLEVMWNNELNLMFCACKVCAPDSCIIPSSIKITLIYCLVLFANILTLFSQAFQLMFMQYIFIILRVYQGNASYIKMCLYVFSPPLWKWFYNIPFNFSLKSLWNWPVKPFRPVIFYNQMLNLFNFFSQVENVLFLNVWVFI